MTEVTASCDPRSNPIRIKNQRRIARPMRWETIKTRKTKRISLKTSAREMGVFPSRNRGVVKIVEMLAIVLGIYISIQILAAPFA